VLEKKDENHSFHPKKKQEFQGTNSPKERSRALKRGSGATSGLEKSPAERYGNQMEV